MYTTWLSTERLVMRVLVCGGRDFDDWYMLKKTLDPYIPKVIDLTIIQGGATGADFLAKVWAKYVVVKMQEFKADWKREGKLAGIFRNKRMLEEGKPDLVIAFPGGKGTANMIDQALKAGVKVIEISKTSRIQTHVLPPVAGRVEE